MYLSLRSAATSPLRFRRFYSCRLEPTYLDEKVVMWRGHYTGPEFTEKTGEKSRLGNRRGNGGGDKQSE